jgi:mono/diheme cytochrome c family protein
MKLRMTKWKTALFAMTALCIALPSGCGKKAPLSLFPLVNSQDLANGKKIYDSRCTMCHGAPDKGNPPRIGPLVNKPSVRGDPMNLASDILYAKSHLMGTGRPYLFESMPDADIAHVGNYLRNIAGATDSPIRAKTVQRAREIHAIKTGKPFVPGAATPPLLPPNMKAPPSPPSFTPGNPPTGLPPGVKPASEQSKGK